MNTEALLKELEEGLEGVTPERLSAFQSNANPDVWYVATPDHAVLRVEVGVGNAQRTAEHFARCSPDNIRALLSLIREERSAREKAERRVAGLMDDKAPMACEAGEMTAAEDVLAWLIIEKIGVPDDVGYSPHDAQRIIVSHLDEAIKLEGELSAISFAIGSNRFLDPPDGGSVTLAEQVTRMRQALDAAESELARLRGELAGGWRVKPLEWGTGLEASSPVGNYRVQRLDDKWEPLRDGYYMLPKQHGVVAAFDTCEAAKAAAQADYEARIRAAIEPATQETKHG